LGHAGPKHHAIVIGKNLSDDLIYVAESMDHGYQVTTYIDFYQRYASNGEIHVAANDGEFDNLTVAQRALEEIKNGGKGVYNLVVNNCECFANRAIHGKSKSQQVINTTLGLLAVAGSIYLIKKYTK
jgi:hypothetical protein